MFFKREEKSIISSSFERSNGVVNKHVLGLWYIFLLSYSMVVIWVDVGGLRGDGGVRSLHYISTESPWGKRHPMSV